MFEEVGQGQAWTGWDLVWPRMLRARDCRAWHIQAKYSALIRLATGACAGQEPPTTAAPPAKLLVSSELRPFRRRMRPRASLPSQQSRWTEDGVTQDIKGAAG